MALRRDITFPGRFTVADPTRPQGGFKDRTSPTSEDGSYLAAPWLSDWDGLFGSLLNAAGLVPNGLVDEAGASQLFDALQRIQYAPNKIKTSQLVVVGVDGNPLPSPAPQNYPIGEDVALGWKALTAVTNLITDSNGNVKLNDVGTDTGTIYYDIDLADNNTPVLATLFGSIMRCTNAATGEYVQIFADDSTALTVSNPTATTARLTIDLVDLEDGFKVAGLSEFRGRLEAMSSFDIDNGLGKPYVDPDAIGANPTALIYNDGTIVGRTDNGSYIKWPNGELKCRGEKQSNSVGGTAIPFPIYFTDTSYNKSVLVKVSNLGSNAIPVYSNEATGAFDINIRDDAGVQSSFFFSWSTCGSYK
jgi:hypothetical protein